MDIKTLIKWSSIAGGTIALITLGAAVITQSSEPFRVGLPLVMFLLLVSAVLKTRDQK